MGLDILIIVWICTVVLAIFACYYIGRKYYRRIFSKRTKKLVERILRRRGALREWKVLGNVTLGEGADAVTVDHLVVAPFGVLIVCDLFQNGNAYGELDSPEWIMAKGEDGKEKKTRIESPYHRGQMAEKELRKLFAKEKVYNIQIETAVAKTQDQASYITGSAQHLYNLKDLKHLLEESRFEKDNGADIAKILALLGEK